MLAFFLVWSAETFLFSINLLPFLIIFAAGTTFTRFRVLGVALAIAVILLGGAEQPGGPLTKNRGHADHDRRIEPA